MSTRRLRKQHIQIRSSASRQPCRLAELLENRLLLVDIGGAVSGTLVADTYDILADLLVPAGESLTIEPGAILRFHPGTGLTIQGSLLADAIPGTAIIFTSASAAPAPGDWDGIVITQSGDPRSIFTRVEIAYAATGISTSVDHPKFTLSGSDVHDNATGISLYTDNQALDPQDVLILNSRIHHNTGKGIAITSHAWSGSNPPISHTNPTISSSEIDHNGAAGIDIYSRYHASGGVVNSSGTSPLVTGNYIHENRIGIAALSSDNTGTFGSAWLGGTYQNNLIAANTEDGLQFNRYGDGILYPSIVNNTIVGNGGAGISHAALYVDYTAIRNNIVAGNTRGIAAQAAFTPAAAGVAFNDVYANPGGNWTNYPAAFGSLTTANPNGTPADIEFNISADPQFLALGNYHIAVSSPAINAGTANGAPATDYDADSRFAAPDIGFDEAPALALTISPALVREDSGPAAATATISRNTLDLSGHILITLTSSDTSEAAVPATVLIPEGLASATVDIAAVDDAILDLVQSARISATAPGWVPAAPQTIQVDDDDLLPPTSASGEFRVNLTAANTQSAPTVAMASDGSFIVVWQGYGPGDDAGIFAQRYSANGAAVGSEFRINTTTSGTQSNPSVAMTPDGRFVVVWQGNGSDDDAGIFAQRYDPAGQPAGGEFRANVATSHTQLAPSVAMAGSGSFIIAWADGQNGVNYDVTARRYDSAGQPVGDPFMANTTTDSDQDQPAVAIGPDGQFVIAWRGNGAGDNWGVFAQRYDSAGQTLGGEFRINTATVGSQGDPALAFTTGGGFVAVWRSDQLWGYTPSIYARQYNASGAPVTDETRISDSGPTSRLAPGVVALPGGRWAVAWYGQTATDGWGVSAQVRRSDMRLIGTEFIANVTTTGNQELPAIAASPDGLLAIAWSGNGPGDSSGVYARRFIQPTPRLALTIDSPSLREHGAFSTTTGTITRSGVNTAAALQVVLGVSDSTELAIPLTVTIPAGQTSATFSIQAIDDGAADGIQTVSLTASATGFDPSSANIMVEAVAFYDDGELTLWALNPSGVAEPPMPLYHNGLLLGSFQTVDAYDRVPAHDNWPLTYADLIANTFLRPTYQNADGTGGLLSSSFVGTMSYRTMSGLRYVPAVNSANVYTGGPDRMRMELTGAFGSQATITSTRRFPDPTIGQTDIPVQLSFTAQEDIVLDPLLLGNDAFRLFTASSMYADADSYDADLIRWLGTDGQVHWIALSESTPRDSHLFTTPMELPANGWFELIKQAGSTWNVGGPSLRVQLNGVSGLTGRLGLQGWLANTADPTDDSLTVWVEWMDAPAVLPAGSTFAADLTVRAFPPGQSPPADLALSPATIAENQPIGTTVGAFSSTDPDLGSTFTYTLATGPGADDNASFTIVGNELRTAATIDYETQSAYSIRVRTTDQSGLWFEKVFTINVTNIREASIAARHLFYNRSAFDGNDAAATAADDNAIAADKTALLPGQTAALANYSSYSRGINGVMLDLQGFSSVLTASDFTFRVGNNSASSGWATAPSPVSLTQRALPNGNTRVTLIWADNAIQKQWLQVTVLASDSTDLATADTFYFGNAIGECGNASANAQVTTADEALTRNNQSGLATVPITSLYDYNRDGRVNSQDLALTRNNRTGLTPLQLITPPAGAGTSARLLAPAPLRVDASSSAWWANRPCSPTSSRPRACWPERQVINTAGRILASKGAYDAMDGIDVRGRGPAAARGRGRSSHADDSANRGAAVGQPADSDPRQRG